MAFICDYEKKSGLIIIGAYVVRNGISLSNDNLRIGAHLYSSKESYKNGKPAEETLRFNVSVTDPRVCVEEQAKEGNHPVKLCENYLMSLECFKNVVEDVVEDVVEVIEEL